MKKQPKLMLRRTETVAEKLLTSWLSFAMYRVLVGEPGRALYNLCQALRLQIQSGAVDAVTGAATYVMFKKKDI